MRSAPVLERAVKGTGNRISAETLGQRLEVDAAKDADVLRIRVVDSTATGAAQLANAVPTAYGQLLGQQSHARSRDLVRQLRNIQSPLKARLAQIEVKLAGGPEAPVLRAQLAAVAAQLSALQRRLRQLRTAPERDHPMPLVARAAVPSQPSAPGPGRAMVTGTLGGLLVAAVLVWWDTRRQGPRSRSSASEPGPEMPAPA